MPELPKVLVAFRNQDVIARIDRDSSGPVLTVPAAGLSSPIAFDRLVLHSPDQKSSVIFNVVCPSAQPTPHNTLTITTAPAGGKLRVTDVSFSASIRCFIGGSLVPDMAFRGHSTAADLGADPDPWKFTQIVLGGASWPGVTFAKLISLSTELPCEFPSPLLTELGLRVKGDAQVNVGFVPAPSAAPTSQPTSDPGGGRSGSPPYVLRFTRSVALEPIDQRLAVGPVTVDLQRTTVIFFHLDGCGSNPAPINLTQTGPVMPYAANSQSNDPAAEGVVPWVVSIAGLPPWPVLEAWNTAASTYIESLQTVTAGRPNTMLPLFDLPSGPSVRCDSAKPPGTNDAAGITFWSITLNVTDSTGALCPDHPRPAPTASFRAALPQPVPPQNMMGVPNQYNVFFPGIICHNVEEPGQLLRFRFNVLSPIGPGLPPDLVQSLTESVWTGFVFCALGLYPKTPDPQNKPFPVMPQRVRIGSLDLQFGFSGMDKLFRGVDTYWTYGTDQWDTVIKTRQSQFQLWFRSSRYLPAAACLPITDTRLFLRVEVLTPGGQDDLPPDMVPVLPAGDLAAMFEREPPIVVPVTLSQPPEKYTLEGLETTRGNASQTISLELYERSPAVSATTSSSTRTQVLVVVDREPLLLARVHAPAFVGMSGSDGNREVGNWLNVRPDGSSWQLAGALDGFMVVFPPQGIGEGTEKRKNLGITEGSAVDFRLTPPAQFQILGSFYQQNFTEASWNLRRILGYPGQQAPGAIIRSLAFELLYGLNCQVRTPGLQLAELAARIGSVAGPLPDALSHPFGTTGLDTLKSLDDAFNEYQSVWADQYSAYQSRLGIFEPWNLAFTTLTVSDKLVYALRTLPDNQPLYPDPAGLGPIPAGLLPGGVLWGLEFESQYQELTKNPTASGELSRPAFSALGGWGYQKAVFANGLTTIYSDTAMGRTFFYSVEQRGRIAGFWNFAKHVVVYERTVAPSAQFAGTKLVPSDQDQLPGRPVLRKVREYVELIQPIRSYPDFNAKPVASGCVQAIEFKSRIIPVNSTWGRDVRINTPTNDDPYATTLQGYALPLWQKGADPSVYPKPHVGIRVAGASVSGETFPMEIAEPEKLLFYADTTADTADTDTWPAVRDIDFLDLAFPASTPINVHPGADLDAPLPSEVPVHGGYEAFTYAVVNERAVNVVATRTTQPLGAVVRNVAMVRSSPNAPTAQQAINAAGGLTNLNSTRTQLTQIMASLPSQGDVQALKQQVSDVFNSAKSKAQQGAAAITGAVDSKLLILTNRWNSLANGTVNRWQTAATSFLNDQIQNGVIPQLSSIQDVKRAQDYALGLLNDRLALFDLTVPGLDPGTRQLQDLLGRVSGSTQQVVDAVTSTAAGATAQFNQLLQGASSLTADLQSRLFQAADDVQQQLSGDVDQTLGQVRNAAARALANLPGTIGQAAQTANDSISGLVGDLKDAIQQQDLSGLNNQIQNLAGLADTVGTNLAGITSAAQATIDDLKTRAASLLDVAVPGAGAGSTVSTVVNGLKDRLLNSIASVTNPTSVSDFVNSLSGQLNSELSGISALAGADVSSVVTSLSNAPDLLGTINPNAVSDQLDQLQSQLGNLMNQSLPLDALRQQVGDLLSQGQGALDDLTSQLTGPLAAQFPAGLAQTAGNTLWLARAFGDAPNVAGMGFNRDQLGYFFNPVASALTSNLPIDISPVNALVNRVGDQLKSVGVRLPVTSLLDQVLPAPDSLLQNFNLGNLLPDFAGLKLDKLLPSLMAPDDLKDKIKITHQFDQQKASGWVQADVNISDPGPTTLFDAGPIRISLADVALTATMRIEAALGGTPQHTQSGQLSADWTLNIGGEDVITFQQTALTFDNAGHTHFNLDPKKIQLNGVLATLSEALQAANSPDGSSDDSSDDSTDDSSDDDDAPPQPGLTFHLKEEGGYPVGVQVILEIALPDVTVGVCGLTNLSFGASLELIAKPEFALAVRAHVAEKTAPFTVTIFILGGGGWFDVRARYLPLSNRITTALSIGVSAGATLAIDFGIVKGSVYAYFYIEAELQTDSAAPGVQLTISIGLVLGGQVDVLGLVSVSIQLLLQLSYSTSDHALTGRGTISLRIKICWLITISVSASVERRFATIGGSGSGGAAPAAAHAHALALHAMALPHPGAAPPDPVTQAVTTYLNTLE